MQQLNPKSPSEAAEEREEREFLEGQLTPADAGLNSH